MLSFQYLKLLWFFFQKNESFLNIYVYASEKIMWSLFIGSWKKILKVPNHLISPRDSCTTPLRIFLRVSITTRIRFIQCWFDIESKNNASESIYPLNIRLEKNTEYGITASSLQFKSLTWLFLAIRHTLRIILRVWITQVHWPYWDQDAARTVIQDVHAVINAS